MVVQAKSVTVINAESLEHLINQGTVKSIRIEGIVDGLSSITLTNGFSLTGGHNAELRFKPGQNGLLLTANNHVSDLRIVVDETLIAVGLADSEKDLGETKLQNIQTIGRFHLEAVEALKGNLTLDSIHVEQADASIAAHRPYGFGVEVLLGAISVYNFSKNSTSRWTLKATNLSCGSKDLPVKGSGVFVFGGAYIPIDADMTTAPSPSKPGGSIDVALLSTGEVHSNGNIPLGTSNLIAAGIFLGSGSHGHEVINKGSVTTYGVNDMVLDNWGNCDKWISHGAITSYGTSGIGFVNFGGINDLQILAPIKTHGIGARGFNLYDGILGSATFYSITTYGNGAIGIQLAKPFGNITVLHDITTKGGEGDSLVRGKVVNLKAHALSLKSGTQGQSFIVKGNVVAENPNIQAFDFDAPSNSIKLMEVSGIKIN